MAYLGHAFLRHPRPAMFVQQPRVHLEGEDVVYQKAGDDLFWKEDENNFTISL